MSVTLRLGYVPLLDAAPVIIAEALGFAEEEGLTLDLHTAPSWAALRDMLAVGQVDAAQMLAPVPVAMALGLGRGPVRFEALCVLNLNGNVIGISNALAAMMASAGYSFDFGDAAAAGRALLAAAPNLRIGVPYTFSMHRELLQYWLAASGASAAQLDIRTVPPPRMAEALQAGEIDLFCVGEPWGSVAVENGSGTLLLPTSALWARARARRVWHREPARLPYGAVLGDSIAYFIGRRYSRAVVTSYGARFRVPESRYAKVEAVFARYGALMVITARFGVLLRQLNGLSGGHRQYALVELSRRQCGGCGDLGRILDHPRL